MKNPIPQHLFEWMKAIGIQSHINSSDIENGKTISAAMKIVVDGYNLQLLSGNTAVNRVTNWNNLIQELKKISIRISQQEKGKIINGNHDIVFQILSRLKDHYARNQKQTQVDISKIDPKADLRDSSSLLQLMIMAIMKNFQLNSKQAVALLSNDSKYLAHILAKGLKSEFKPIQNFITQLRKSVTVIQQFCKNRQNQNFFIKSMKPGLISKSELIAQNTLALLLSFMENNSHEYQILQEHLMPTFILGIRRHPHMMFKIVQAIMKIANYHKNMLQLIRQHTNANDLMKIISEIWQIAQNQRRSEQLFNMKGFGKVVDSLINHLGSADTVLSALAFLLVLCASDANLLDHDKALVMIENLAQVQLAKDTIVLINLQFSLLHVLGQQKNALAPQLYKILVEKYHQCLNQQQSIVYIENFINTLQTFPSIPIGPVIQIINSRAQAGSLAINSPEIEFFKMVFEKQALDVKYVLIIYNIISKILLEDVSMMTWVGDFIGQIVGKHKNQQIILQMTTKLLKVCLAIHFGSVKKYSHKRKSITGNGKLDPEETLSQAKNAGIELFVMRIIQLNLKEINQLMQPLITYTYLQQNQMSPEHAKKLYPLLKFFGSPQQLIKKYPLAKQQDHKLNKAKSSKFNSQIRYQSPNKDEQVNSSDQVSLLTRKKVMSGYTNPMYLSHLSQIGVSMDAQKGLEKYQKVYLQKVQKQKQQEIKKVMHQQRTQMLKKVYEKKLHQIGISARPDQEYKCIYQFDVKEKILEQQRVKGNSVLIFFDKEVEEERDLKALQYFMKRYNRIIKLYFNQYSNSKKIGAVKTFDQITEKKQTIEAGAVWKIIREHALDEFTTLEQVKQIIRKVNYNLKKDLGDANALDLQGFEQFFIQFSFVIFSRPPKDLRGRPIQEMVQQTFSRLKLYCGQNRIDPRNFEQPQSIYYNETQALIELNKKLEENSNYILPEGYKKIVEKKIEFTHKIFLEAMSPDYKDVYQVLDQLLFKSLGIHIIEPFTTYKTIARARPALYFSQRIQGNQYANQVAISFQMKKQVAKFPIKDRQIAKQAASILEEVIQAVEFGRESIGQKKQNKILREKKDRQEQIKKKQIQLKAKRAQRDRQLKTQLEQLRVKAEQKKRQQTAKKRDEKSKIKTQKDKQKRQQEQLKKKVQAYQQKKKEEETKKKQQERQRKRREKQEEERKKQQNDEIKRKIQQTKQQKAQQERQKKREQQEEAKRKQKQQKKKLQQKQKEAKAKIEEYKSKIKSSNLRNSKSPQKSQEEANQNQ